MNALKDGKQIQDAVRVSMPTGASAPTQGGQITLQKAFTPYTVQSFSFPWLAFPDLPDLGHVYDYMYFGCGLCASGV
ncbi:hypothetical protein AB0K00_40390 [Dactylosporangium sp. NPDC049525]|uniref:hypothetical protein n=1 Tax=Dactylosporangium sp. NPDC049525 TaxID=3154730 RepID=UPI0034234077